jgi:hypothetical protein
MSQEEAEPQEEPSCGSGVCSAPAGPLHPVIAPSRHDPVVRMASQVLGGPAGSRLATARGFWRTGTVLVLLAMVLMSLGIVERQHCRAEGWSEPDMFWHACYSDIAVVYTGSRLAQPDSPDLRKAVGDSAIDQPPLSAAAMWLVSQAIDPERPGSAPRRFFDLSAIALAACLAAAVIMLVLAAGRRRWDAAHLALSPLIVTAGLVNYQMLAVVLLVGALLAWGRYRPQLSGLLLGAAACTAPLLASIGVGVLALSLRAGRRVEAALFVATGTATWLAVRIVFKPGVGAQTLVATFGMLLGAFLMSRAPHALRAAGAALFPLGAVGVLFAYLSEPATKDAVLRSWDAWRAQGASYGSLWMIPQLMERNRPGALGSWFPSGPLSAGTVTAVTAFGLVVVLLGVVLLVFGAQHRPRLAQVALVLTVGTILVSKSIPVQASLLLLPMVALSGLRWRDHLFWATTEIIYFISIWTYIAGSWDQNRGMPAGLYLIVLLLRLTGIAWIGVQGIRAILDPHRDPVRLPEDDLDGRDDPQGGPLDESPDALRFVS